MADRTVLVTGAGGFVGSRLVEALYLTGFGEVRAGVRRWPSAARVARLPVNVVLCDMSDPDQAAAAMVGVTHVVHCASADGHEAIVGGTRVLLEAALGAGVRSFVYLSSAEAYGGGVTGRVDEAAACRPEKDSYGGWKLEAEGAVEEYRKRGLATTVLRPAIIYGPFSESWTVRLARRLQSGNWGLFEEMGEGICNLVYIDDLIRCIMLCLERGEAAGETFNVVGPDRPTWNEYFRRYNDALGLPPLPTVSSRTSVRTAAVRDRVNKVTSFFVGRFQAPLMRIYLRGGWPGRVMKAVKTRLTTTASGRELRGLYSRRADLVTDRIERALGFRPSVGLDQGLGKCRDWLAFSGYLQSAGGTDLPGGGQT